MKKIFILLMVAALLPLSLLSCKSGGDTEVTEAVYYTVTFDSNGGSEVKTQKILEGAKISRPADPIRENFVFDRWTLKGKGDWLFDADTVKSDVTLVAQWVSADNLFNYEPTENTNALITGFKDGYGELPQNIVLPTMINGLNVVGVSDGAFKDISSEKVYSFTLPIGVSYIGKNAFANCAGIKITVNGALTFIGDNAFRGCDGLTDVKFGDGLESIGAYAFEASGIKRAAFPKTLKLICENAFSECDSLVVVEMHTMEGEAKYAVENSVFLDCSSLKTVFFYGTESEFDTLDKRIDTLNNELTNAKICFYSENKPTESGNFWHMVDGEPREW